MTYLTKKEKAALRAKRAAVVLGVLVLLLGGALAFVMITGIGAAHPAPAITEPVKLNAGIYEAGVDFKAGAYTITPASELTVGVYLHRSKTAFDADAGYIFGAVIATGTDAEKVGRLDISAGQLLEITAPVTMSGYTGISTK